MQFQIQHLDNDDNQDARDDADDDGAKRVHGVTAGGYADQTGQRGVQTHRNIRFSVLEPGKEHRGTCGNGRCDRSGHKDGCKRVSIPCSSPIEPIPAEPENETSKCAQGDGMARNSVDFFDLSEFVPGIFSKARAYYDRTDKRRNTSDRMDRSGSGKIMESHLDQPALGVPYPASLDRINEKRDHS